MLKDTHLMFKKINYVGDREWQLQRDVLMTNIAAGVPSISSFLAFSNKVCRKMLIKTHSKLPRVLGYL